MKKCILFLIVIVWPVFTLAEKSCQPVLTQVDKYLLASASKDFKTLGDLINPDEIMFLGMNANDRLDTQEQVLGLFRDHYQYWETARFSERRFTACRITSGLASVSFDVTFSPTAHNGTTSNLLLRYLTVWKKQATTGQWLLTHSLYSFPTVSTVTVEEQE